MPRVVVLLVLRSGQFSCQISIQPLTKLGDKTTFMAVESSIGFRLLMLHHIALIEEAIHGFVRYTNGDRLARNVRRYNECRGFKESALSSGKG